MSMSSSREASSGEVSIPLERNRVLLLAPGTNDYVFEVQRGLVSVETQINLPRRRIIDFLLPGDVLSSRTLVGKSEVRLRAIERSQLQRCNRRAWVSRRDAEQILRHSEAATTRAYLANAILGLTDVDARVATFMLALATRQHGTRSLNPCFELAMTREEVADYILVNPDTLSRSYSRLREQGTIDRNVRNHIIVSDWDRLMALTPLTEVVRGAFATPEMG